MNDTAPASEMNKHSEFMRWLGENCFVRGDSDVRNYYSKEALAAADALDAAEKALRVALRGLPARTRRHEIVAEALERFNDN